MIFQQNLASEREHPTAPSGDLWHPVQEYAAQQWATCIPAAPHQLACLTATALHPPREACSGKKGWHMHSTHMLNKKNVKPSRQDAQTERLCMSRVKSLLTTAQELSTDAPTVTTKQLNYRDYQILQACRFWFPFYCLLRMACARLSASLFINLPVCLHIYFTCT